MRLFAELRSFFMTYRESYKRFSVAIFTVTTLLSLVPAAECEVVRTGYTTIIAGNSGKCLDITGASSLPGAPAIQWHCNFNSNEQWTVQPSGTAYNIIEQNTGQCLTVSGVGTAPGAQIVQSPCNNAKTQLWSFTPNGQQFQIVSGASGQCLSVSNNSTADIAPIVQQQCSTASNFLWTFTSGLLTSSSLSVLQAGHSGECLGVSSLSGQPGASVIQPGASVIQWPCAGGGDALWTLVPAGGYYHVVSQNGALCLTASGAGNTVTAGASTASGAGTSSGSGSGNGNGNGDGNGNGNGDGNGSGNGNGNGKGSGDAAGTAIVVSQCGGASGALWTLTPVGGAYELIARNGGQCLVVAGASPTPGALVALDSCSGSKNQLWSLSSAMLRAAWTSVIPLPVDPIAVANLPSGKLLMWSANDQYSYEGDIGNRNGQTYTAVFDPSNGGSSEILVTNTGDDMFCPGIANLFDGRILVNGGDSSPKTSLYDPSTGLWTSDALMNIPRGYEGDTVLTNGSVMTFGGSWSGGFGGKTAEVWTAGSGWAVLPGVPETSVIGPDPQGIYRGDNHLWLFSAPNGQVFHAGPSAEMHWITTSGTGTITSVGNRGDDPYSINGNAVLYDVGLILKAGGAPAYENANAEANSYLVNINGTVSNSAVSNNGVNPVTVTKLAPMAFPRTFSNGVVLPNGQVVIIGGQTFGAPFSDSTAILIPEIWDPQTQVFRQLAPMQTPRVYHSTGILLSDGRVYSGGGGQCGFGCAANHFNAEILTPPYLLNPDGTPATRPVISSASSSVALGATISATTTSPVVSFVLMRLSSVTHTVNNDQRRIPLQIQSTTGNAYTLAVPSNPGIVLPGNYWLFALNAQGVPSVAANVVIH
jgi:galactose oxidase